MAQHTVFVEFYYPSDVKTILSCNSDDEVKKACFGISKFDTETEAVDAYEQTQSAWSVIIDDDQDVHEFIDKAYEALKNNDYHWLYKHFV